MGVARGFLLSNGSYTPLVVPGATLTVATSINNAGDIVGYYIDGGGVERPFLATPGPIPEPCTGLLLTIAMLSLGGWAFRHGFLR